MVLKSVIVPCVDLQKYLTKYGNNIKHIIHITHQCSYGILTDKMILVIETASLSDTLEL
jgi:hypothetical protein